MKELFRYGFILALICALASGLLSAVNSYTQPKIIAQAKAEEATSLEEIMPGAVNFEPIKDYDDIIYYKVSNADGKFIGVAFKASGKGYSGAIETMVGMDKEGTIRTIKILHQNETPGLGNRIMELPFLSQFAHKGISDLTRVEAITGATISSKAVIDSVKEKAEEIKELMSNDKAQNPK